MKQVQFVYHPNTTKNNIDTENIRQIKIMIAEFLIKKAMEKAAK